MTAVSTHAFTTFVENVPEGADAERRRDQADFDRDHGDDADPHLGVAFQLVDRGGKVSASDLEVVGDVIAVEKREAAPQRELTGERATGTVKFFNAMKGFGFITRDDGQPDAFVHISAVERSGMSGLNEGDRLEFDIEVDRRGKYSAVNLTPRQD